MRCPTSSSRLENVSFSAVRYFIYTVRISIHTYRLYIRRNIYIEIAESILSSYSIVMSYVFRDVLHIRIKFSKLLTVYRRLIFKANYFGPPVAIAAAAESDPESRSAHSIFEIRGGSPLPRRLNPSYRA